MIFLSQWTAMWFMMEIDILSGFSLCEVELSKLEETLIELAIILSRL